MGTFFKAALMRALRTVFQTALAMITTGAMGSDINWKTISIASVLAGLTSIATSLTTGLPEAEDHGGTGTPGAPGTQGTPDSPDSPGSPGGPGEDPPAGGAP